MIAIPNMDKPKDCQACPIFLWCYTANDWKGYEHCSLIEIVRCGECIHHDEDGWGYGECKRPSVVYLRTADEDFCSYGERRADEDTVRD